MTICEQCGAPAQAGESFCGACGAYLEWQEPTPDETGPIAPASRPAAASKSEQAAADAEPASPATDLVEPGPHANAVPLVEPTPVVEPTRHVEAPAERVAPVRPGAASPRPRRRELLTEDRRPLPGETICPDCGAGNVPTRRFCRRCGADLVDAPVVPELPWYRRLFRRAPRPARVAGSRPKRRRSMRGLNGRLGILVLLLVIVGGGWFGRGRVLGVVDLARDRFSNEQVYATKFTASSAARGHPAKAANDGAPNVYWSPRPTKSAVGESVTLGLETPVRLAYVNIFNGPTSEGGKPFRAVPGATAVRLSMTQSDGKVVERTLTLKDAAGAQPFHIGVDEVRSVKVTVVGTFASRSDKRVALGEVELIKRS